MPILLLTTGQLHHNSLLTSRPSRVPQEEFLQKGSSCLPEIYRGYPELKVVPNISWARYTTFHGVTAWGGSTDVQLKY